MRKIVSFTIIILTLCSAACFLVPEATDQFPPRKLKPYDPEKAGAVIVESFDLTNSGLVPGIKFFNGLAEYNGCIYLRSRSRLYIFEKETLQKRRDLWINFSNIIDIRASRGLAVVNDDTAILLCHRSSGYDLVSIDLSTGDSLIINDEEEWGFSLNPDFPYPLIGYNKDNNSIWFLRNNGESSRYHYIYQPFQYDVDEKKIIALDNSKEFFLKFSSNIIVETASVYGKEIWNTVYKRDTHSGQPTIVGIEKRSLDNPDEVLHFIDVEYLGTLSIPQSIIYDKPYIWMLAERDNQVQMLKLLPKG